MPTSQGLSISPPVVPAPDYEWVSVPATDRARIAGSTSREPHDSALQHSHECEMLEWLVHERGIEPHVPVFDKPKRTDGSFSRQDFTYDHQGEVYVCAAGKM